MKHFWKGFEKKAGFTLALGTLTGVRDFGRGVDIINKSIKSGRMNSAGEIAKNLTNRKSVAGRAMSGGLLRMGATGGLGYYALRSPDGTQEHSV